MFLKYSIHYNCKKKMELAEKLSEIAEEESIRQIVADEWIPLTDRENQIIWLGVTAGLVILTSLIYFLVSWPV